MKSKNRILEEEEFKCSGILRESKIKTNEVARFLSSIEIRTFYENQLDFQSLFFKFRSNLTKIDKRFSSVSTHFSDKPILKSS